MALSDMRPRRADTQTPIDKYKLRTRSFLIGDTLKGSWNGNLIGGQQGKQPRPAYYITLVTKNVRQPS